MKKVFLLILISFLVSHKVLASCTDIMSMTGTSSNPVCFSGIVSNTNGTCVGTETHFLVVTWEQSGMTGMTNYTQYSTSTFGTRTDFIDYPSAYHHGQARIMCLDNNNRYSGWGSFNGTVDIYPNFSSNGVNPVCTATQCPYFPDTGYNIINASTTYFYATSGTSTLLTSNTNYMLPLAGYLIIFFVLFFIYTAVRVARFRVH